MTLLSEPYVKRHVKQECNWDIYIERKHWEI